MTRSASPRGTPIPAPIATSSFDGDDGDEDEDDATCTEEEFEVNAKAGVVAVTVTVAVFVILGDVEPDVRLNITCPAGTKKGTALPLVISTHVLFNESTGLQQKTGLGFIS